MNHMAKYALSNSKKKMKISLKSISLLAFLFLALGFLVVSCEKDDVTDGIDPNADIGNPVVKYIRSTNPEAADSLLVSAFMGSLIAIVGEDLDHTVEIWFNDQKASLTPTYVTNQTIIVNVPSSVPTEVNDKITFVFSNGEEMLYDFKVDVPAPILRSIKCEHVPAGGIAVLEGDFFFAPVEVTFPGEVKGEIVTLEKLKLEVIVPEGATTGNIVISTNFGEVESAFIFRDTMGLFWDFDQLVGGGWRPGNLASANGVSGNYAVLSGELGGDWDWKDDFLEIDLWAQAAGRPQGPLFNGIPDEMALTFEVNVVKEWTGGFMQFIFSQWDNANNSVNTDNTVAKGLWIPWEDEGSYMTDGWVTVSLPLSEFTYNHEGTIENLKLNYPDGCGSLSIFVFGPVPLPPNDIEIHVDNFRVVPK